MTASNIPTLSDAAFSQSESLITGYVLAKSLKEGAQSWRFSGVASDESRDVEGDQILKKSLDLTYAQRRGYVNWDHSRSPEDQLGFLERVDLVDAELRKSLEEQFGFVSPTASVYVEGSFYKHVRRAGHVVEILKSMQDQQVKEFSGVGLSLDGALARDSMSKGIIRAFVRGVAITPTPAHTRTLCALLKSLEGCSGSNSEESDPTRVAEQLAKSDVRGLTEEEAIVWLLRQRPRWTYEFAKRVVGFTIDQRKKE